MICSRSVPICNRFHTIKANNGKITYFKGVPLFDVFIRGKPPHPRHEILSLKTRIIGGAHSGDFVILACNVLIQIISVTRQMEYGQTDRQTDA